MKRFLVTAALLAVAGVLGACSKHEGTTAPPPAPSAAAPTGSTLNMMPSHPMTAHPVVPASTAQTSMNAATASTASPPATGGGR